MDDEIAEIVRQYGWYSANVHDANPPFLYTIGLMLTHDHPEFIIIGLEADKAYGLVSQLIQDICDGKRYAADGVASVKIGHDEQRVGFRCVHPTQHPLYLGFAMGFLRRIGRFGELSVMQVFWPDESGRFPFDRGCNARMHSLQPRLDISLTPSEIRDFERRWE